MKSIQFIHNIDSGRTIAVEEIPVQDLMDLIDLLTSNQPPQGEFAININVGIAKLHPKDKYIKAEGRKIAVLNMSSVLFNVQRVDIRMDGNIYFLIQNGNIALSVMVNRSKTKTYAISAWAR